MAMTEELKIKISVDSKGAEQNAKRVKNSIKGIGDEGSKTGGKVGKLDEQMAALKGQLGNFKGAEAFKGMTAAAASAAAAVGTVVVAVAGLVGMTKNAIAVSKLGKEIAVSAQQTGMTTNAYQEWSYVLEKVGIEAGKLTDFVKALTQAQIQAVQGSEDTAMAFQTLGLSMEQVQSMDQSQLFAATIQGLQGMGDASLRNAIAFQIFGEDAVQLATLLNLTSGETYRLSQHAYQLGAVMNQATIRSSVQLQGAMGDLRAAFQGVKNTLAEAFLPTLIRVVQWITIVIAKINILLRVVFGLQLGFSKGAKAASGVGGGGGGISGYNKALDSAAKSAGGAGKATDDASKAIEKMGKKAKGSAKEVEKLKKQLMGFDELNVLKSFDAMKGAGDIDMPDLPKLPDIGGAGGIGGLDDLGGIGGIGGGGFDDLFPGDEELAEFEAWCEKYKNRIQDIATFSLLGIGALGAVIMLLHGNILGAVPFLGLLGLGIAIGSVDGGSFERLGEKIKTWWNGTMIPWWEEKVKPIFTKQFWVDKWNAVKNATVEKLNEIKEKISTWWNSKIVAWWDSNVKPLFTKEYWNELWNNIKTKADEKLSEIGEGISNWWNDTIVPWWEEKVKPVFTKEYWVEKWDNIKNKTSEKLDEIKTKIISWWDEKIKPWWNEHVAKVFTAQFWIDKWNTVKQKTSEKLNEIKEDISGWWNGKVKPWWNENVAKIFTASFWQEKWNTVKSKTSEKLNEIKQKLSEWWNSVKSWWSSNVQKIFTSGYWSQKWETVTSTTRQRLDNIRSTLTTWWGNVRSWWNTNVAKIFTSSYWSGKWESIKSAISSALSSILNTVSTQVERIKQKILDLLHFRDSSGVDDPLPPPRRSPSGGGYRGRNIEARPFATGGIVTRSVFANIGEAGTEAVLPLENNTGWMDALADRIAERQNTPSQVVLKIGEEEFAWATINGINNITKQTGGLQLAL